MKQLLLPILALLFASAAFAQESQGTGLNTDPAYKLSERDLVEVSVYDEPDLLTVQRVDNDGNLRVPLLGSVPVGGMTIREAEATLAEAFVEQRFLRAPQVTLTLREYAPREVSVFGQVQAPGRVPLPPDSSRMDIVEAISRAGGFTGIAKGSSVRVTRSGGGSFTVNVDDIIRGRSKRTYYVSADDKIFVPERLF